MDMADTTDLSEETSPTTHDDCPDCKRLGARVATAGVNYGYFMAAHKAYMTHVMTHGGDA